MKSISKLIIFVFTFLALTASAYAQSPSEQLQQMVQQLQKTPTDNALREKIIKLGTEIKPAPAVPPEAKRPFVMAGTYQKEAKKPSDFALAIDAYQDVLKVAPWWGDAYYNLSVSLESAGRLGEAKIALERYLLTKPKDAEEAQNRLYALDAKKNLAVKQAAEKASSPEDPAASQKQRDDNLVRSLNGVRFDCPNRDFISSGSSELNEAWLVINGSQLTEWTKVIRADPDLARANPSSYGLGTVHPTSSPIVGSLARGETYNVGRNYKIASDRIVIEHTGIAPISCGRR
jgi:tetratricopeptide (TPR) repeat protein